MTSEPDPVLELLYKSKLRMDLADMEDADSFVVMTTWPREGASDRGIGPPVGPFSTLFAAETYADYHRAEVNRGANVPDFNVFVLPMFRPSRGE